MKIYHYHSKTKEFIGTGEADKDPMDANNWLIPAHACTEEPLENKDGFAAVRVGGKHGEWQQLIDKRGTKYWLADGSKHTINEIGVDVPNDALLSPPEPTQAELSAEKAKSEHYWVKSELDSTTIKLMYHWTGDHRASNTEQAWKDYAIALRDYTSTDENGNPVVVGESRPIIEDFIEVK